MNFGIVIKVLGNILNIEALLLTVPLAVSFFWKENAAQAFLYAIIVTAIIGFVFSRVKASTRNIKMREALCIVAFGWVLVSLSASLPYIFSGSIPNFVDAFFESASGLTTTGASILNQPEIMPRGILFWRSFTQWIGGMGILVLTLAVLPAIGVGGYQIFKAELPGPISDKLAPKLADTAKILYIVYCGLTFLETCMLLIGGLPFYDALLLSFTTVSTGGYAIYNNSIVGLSGNNTVIMTLAIFMIISGVNFSLYYDLWHRRWHSLFKNSELRLYLAIVAVCVLVITINLTGAGISIIDNFKHALFQVGSIITTTGFTSTDYDQWHSFSKSVLFFLMFVGGSAGSTAGSIKIIRILVLGKVVKREVSKLLHSRALVPITINGRIIPNETVDSITSFFVLYMVLFAAATLLISLEGIGLVSSAGAVAATLGNIGPGFDFVGPTQTYSEFSSPAKILLSLMMLLGRLELFTLFAILTPGFWKH